MQRVFEKVSKPLFDHNFGLRQAIVKIQIVMCRLDKVGGATTKNRTIWLNHIGQNQ